MKVYLVGGAVRDSFLGLPVTDRDWVVVGSTAEEMLAKNFKPIGKSFPVFLHPITKEEYALARTESKTGKGHKNFSFDISGKITLEQDLARRDLTINAVAQNDTGELIDPFNGVEDIKNKILRHVSPAFVEDPLRVLRVARFAARFGYRVAPETLMLMQEVVSSGELDFLTPERVWNEIQLAMGADYPSLFIKVLRACNALAVLFHEIDRLFGIPQPAQHHPEIDTGVHTLMALDQAARLDSNPQIRFAVLLHDLGKGTTRKDQLPNHHGHEERGVKLITAFCQRYRVPKQYRELAIQVSRYHLICHRVRELRASTVLQKLEAMDAFRQTQRFKKFLICCEADARGRAGFEDHHYPQTDYFSNALNVASNINIDLFKCQGLEGQAMGDAIRKERLATIQAWLAMQ